MAPRVTAYDIAQAGSMAQLIGQSIEQLRYGKMEDKEFAAQLLRSLTEMKTMVEDSSQKNDKKAAYDEKLALKSEEVFNPIMDNIGLIVQQQGIKPLVTVLTGGSSGLQRDAAGCLANIAFGRRDCQEKIVAAGGIKPLTTILRTGDASTMEQAAAAIASISQNLSMQEKIIASGAIAPLVNLLKGNMRHDAQINAAQALANLATNNKDSQVTIAKAKAIPSLLDLLAAGKAQEATSRAIGQLALENLENQKEICKLGGIAKLLPSLSGVNTEAQVAAAGAIAALAGGERNKSRQTAIAKAGGLRPILALVVSRYDSAKAMGLHALGQVCVNNRANQDEIARLEGLPPLALLVSSGATPPEVQKYACRALAELVRHNYANQTTIADLGVISLLVSLLRSTNVSAVEAEVAGALGALAEGHVVNQSAVASAGAVSVLVGLLGSRSDAAANNAGNALSAIGLDNTESQREISKLLVGLLTTAKRESTQERAAAALWRLVRENPSDQMSIAQAGGAQPLVRLLREGTPGGRSFALWSLSLCINETNQGVVVESGAIEPLVNMLMSVEKRVTEQAAGAINKLATIETVERIAKAGAISPLISLLDSVDSDGPSVQHAAGALAAVALAAPQRVSIDHAGGITPLVALLVDPLAVASTKRYAAAALALLSNEDEDVAKALAEEAAEEERRRVAELDQQWELAQAAELAAQGALAPAPAAASAETAAEHLSSGQLSVTPRHHQSGNPPSAVPTPEKTRKKRPGPAEVNQADNKTKTIDRSPRKRAIWNEGAIPPLVALLALHGDAQEEAAAALRALAEDERIREAITQAGGIGPLVALLGGNNPQARDNAEGALVRMSTEMANRVLIIEQLVAMLHNPDIAAREQAAAAISNLAHESTANCSSIVDAGGIPPLLALLESDSAKAKENSASAITQLARGSRPNQDAITKAGGIPMLVSLLTANNSKGDVKQEQLDAIISHATCAIWMMAKNNFPNQLALAESGVITPLVSMLGNASPELQLPATGAIECLLRSTDIQAAIVRTGAIAPLCMLTRDGIPETQEQAAAALRSLAVDSLQDIGTKNNPMANRSTIAKLGGIEALVKMFVVGGSEKSQKNAAGALAAIACKHNENRALVAKRIVSQINNKTTPEVAARTLAAVTRMCGRKVATEKTWQNVVENLNSEESANQTMISKLGGVPAIIAWLSNTDEDVQREAAHALLAMATNNSQTQAIISKSDGLERLIEAIGTGSLETQEHAALALWHLASSPESQQSIADAKGVPALVSMFGAAADGDINCSRAAELAAVTIVRLAQGNPKVSISVADAGGVVPLVKLLSVGAGAAQQAASALAELACVARNRDAIANSGGIEPLIKLLGSETVGTPEIAARALASLARADDEEVAEEMPAERAGQKMCGAEERRAYIKHMGGIERLISMLDGSNLSRKISQFGLSGAQLWSRAAAKMEEAAEMRKNIAGVGQGVDVGIKMGMQEQAAAALAEFANGDADMQDAIIDAGGVPKLLALVHEGKSGSPIAQEHAARTIGHLSLSVENQKVISDEGCISVLVHLVQNGNPKAQEVGAFALANIARGAKRTGSPDCHRKPGVAKRKSNRRMYKKTVRVKLEVADTMEVKAKILTPEDGFSSPDDELEESQEDSEYEDEFNDGLSEIAKEGGIPALVDLMNSRNAEPLAKENAASALYHLAIDTKSRDLIAQHNGIAPLVGLLSDGTHQAQLHASDALARLANQGPDHQAQIAKKLVGLLMAHNSTTVQMRSAHALQMLAADNPSSPVGIVGAGAISPLVHLLSTTGNEELKKKASEALQTIVAGSDDNAAAVTDLVILLDTGSLKSQELIAKLLLTLCNTDENRKCISKSGALQKLVVQLMSQSPKVQELAAAVLSRLSGDSPQNIAAIAAAGGVNRTVALLKSSNTDAQAHAAAIIADLANDSPETLEKIVQAEAITPLVNILTLSDNTDAKAEAAGALGRIAHGSPRMLNSVVDKGAIDPLVLLLQDMGRRAQRKAASALAHLVSGNPQIQRQIVAAGGVELLVNLLDDDTRPEVQAHAAAALAELAAGNPSAQTAIMKSGGIPLLVAMLQETALEAGMEAGAAAIKTLVNNHPSNQIAVAACGGIAPLIARLATAGPSVQSEATHALVGLASGSPHIVESIATLIVKLLGEQSSTEYAERAARAIAHLARSAAAMQNAIADAGGLKKIVALLQSSVDGALAEHASSKASSPAISRRSSFSFSPSRQRPSSPAPSLSFNLLHSTLSSASSAQYRRSPSPGSYRRSPSPALDPAKKKERQLSLLQHELSAAIRSLASHHPVNQAAAAELGAVPLLISLLRKEPLLPFMAVPSSPESDARTRSRRPSFTNPVARTRSQSLVPSSPIKGGMLGSPSTLTGANRKNSSDTDDEPVRSLGAFVLDDCVQREAAGALWSLAAFEDNCKQIASAQGVGPLIDLLNTGSPGAQETAAGALNQMAKSAQVCVAISDAQPISALSVVLDRGTPNAKDEAAGCLTQLAFDNSANQLAIATELVKILSNSKPEDLERASQLAHDVAHIPQACSAMADVGLAPLLVRQIEAGTEKSGDLAANALSKFADVNAEMRGEITNQLIYAQHHATDLKRGRRAGKALDDMNASAYDGIGDDTEAQEAVGMAILMFRLHTRD